MISKNKNIHNIYMINQNLFGNIINISYAFLIAGLIVVFLTVGTYNQNALIGTISGYASATCAILLLTGLVYTVMINENKSSIWNILLSLLPFILLLFIFAISLTFTSIYFQNIANNRVSNYYGMFSYLSVLLILIESYMFYSITNQKTFRENGYMSNLSITKIVLLEVINILLLISIGVSLAYFSTDG